VAKNTALEYMYRDGANYKQHERIVLQGALTPEQVTAIRACLEDGEYFIAAQVGLEDLRERWQTHHDDIDHIWHELVSIEQTDEAPDYDLTAQEVFERFTSATWDVAAADKRLHEWFEQTPRGR
jgi:hypothetical protein